MKYLAVMAILLGLLLSSIPAFGYTASKFVSDYGNELSAGSKIKVLVIVKGEPESTDPIKRAKEIRHLQAAVLKFSNFAGAINVRSDSWNNEFSAIVTTSLAKVLEERNDVISVLVIHSSSDSGNKILLPLKLNDIFNKEDITKLPHWIQQTIFWYVRGEVSESEILNAINFLLIEKN